MTEMEKNVMIGGMTETEKDKNFSMTMSKTLIEKVMRSGLSLELQRGLIPHNMNTLERAFEVVQELEHHLKASNVVKQTNSRKSDFRVGTSETPTSKGFTTINLVKIADEKGALVDAHGGGTTRCYKCQGFGHLDVHCPTEATRNLWKEHHAEGQYEFDWCVFFFFFAV